MAAMEYARKGEQDAFGAIASRIRTWFFHLILYNYHLILTRRY